MGELDGPAGSDDAPIVLYDGVCNLCDASVNFIIDHDRSGAIRFAALQSGAARSALSRAGGAGDLPDSVVLIDGAGVHTQSTAALKIAARLRFPWPLLAILLIVPRILRDPMYAWVARNRYRWFGQQVACRIPTPERRSRFLDAEEPARVEGPEAPSAVTGAPAVESRGLGLGTLPGRFLLIYPIVFMLPFPLTLLGMANHIPGFSETSLATAVEGVISLHGDETQPIIAWMGRLFTGEDPSFEFTGSGDGLASYLGVLLDIVIAMVLAMAWWAWRRGHAASFVTRELSRVLTRYYVAYVMLSYGFSKLFPLQFSQMGPDRLLQPYGESSPMGLLWTFMGASPQYQMFGGAAEVLGGLLLLFRRTTLLGALVVIAVMTNVVAMNLFFDVPVKLYSFHYLMLAVVLALPDVPRMFGFFVGNVPVAAREQRPFWFGSPGWRRGLGIAKVVLVVSILGTQIQSRVDRMRESGPWSTPHELRGVYRVESFEVLDADVAENASVPDAVRWVRVGLNPPWVGTVQFADGRAVRMRMRLDEEASTMALFDRAFSEPPTDPLELDRLEEGRIRLAGVFDDVPVRITMRPEASETLFESRGFRWISEYPFNR